MGLSGGYGMSAATIIIILRLLAGIYGVDPALATCIVERESDYNVDAVNGACAGLVQWHPDTRAWLAEKAAGDPAWMHGDIGEGPVFDLALMAFWIARGMGPHWSTWTICGGEG